MAAANGGRRGWFSRWILKLHLLGSHAIFLFEAADVVLCEGAARPPCLLIKSDSSGRLVRSKPKLTTTLPL